MGWNWLKDFWQDPVGNKVAGYLIGKDGDDRQSAPLQARQQYFSLTLECMRIVLEREGVKKFFGVVTAHVGFDLDRGPEAITLIISPESLKGIERADLGKIIVQTIPICEKIPYIGESIELRIALMSLEMANLLDGVVDILSSVAKAAGVGYVEQAKAFLAPIEKGIDLLTKQGGTEVGVYKAIDQPRTGYYCVARSASGRLDLAASRLSADWRLIDQNGREVTDVPYFVIRVDAHDKKDNFAKIPSIRNAFDRMRDSALEGDDAKARSAFELYKRIVLWSADLLEHDREPMIKFAQSHLDKTFPPAAAAATPRLGPARRKFPELDELRL